MSREYSPKDIEKKWQDIWDKEEAFKVGVDKSKPKYYALVEFPYPSGAGLHVGHPRPYTAMDIVSRKRRMQGYNVLFPMGWDAFGLPTENYAIKNKIHPRIVTKNNVERFKSQLKALGYSFDWSKEVNTTDEKYYKWTQWIFLQLFKKGLAYKSEMPINFCTSCKVGLANEEVVNGVCERCGSEVIRKMQSQWMLKITEYADKLIEGLDHVDYIEKVKVSQKNWIGRSEGAEVEFQIKDKDETLLIYTTRPDTLFGATYMVISPEHPLIEKYKAEIGNYDEIAGQLRLPGEATFSGNLLSFEMIKQKTNRGMTDYFRILTIPALFRYAASVGKISAFPIEMLDTPVSKTEGIILMQSFLLRRIDAMNRKEISDCTIFWKDIFAVGRDEGASRQQLQKTRGFICKILDYWKEKGFLKDYQADNRSRGKIKITPNYDFGRVQEYGKELPSG